VHVIGLARPQKLTRYPSVRLRNSSPLSTKDIWIETIISGREGRIARITSHVSSARSPGGRVIPAHDDGWIQEPGLQSSSLVLFAGELRSNCLRVTVVFAKVDFADGSSWNSDQDQGQASPNYPDREDSGTPCKGSTATQAELEKLARAQYDKTSAEQEAHDPSEARAYFFICSLVPDSSGLVAMCPY